MASTPVIYMMANQLPLLGLAYVPVVAHSSDPEKPYSLLRRDPGNLLVPSRQLRKPNDSNDIDSCGSALHPFGEARAATRASKGMGKDTLDVVALSDPNDLLSWGIPAWYLQAQNCAPTLRITNVFVSNAPHWLSLFEDHRAAHSNYFRNPSVWNIIRCGAMNGSVRCARQ
jgi:hypothetical protein